MAAKTAVFAGNKYGKNLWPKPHVHSFFLVMCCTYFPCLIFQANAPQGKFFGEIAAKIAQKSNTKNKIFGGKCCENCKFQVVFWCARSHLKNGQKHIVFQTEQLFWSRKKFVQKKQTFWAEVLDRKRKTCFLYNLFVQLFPDSKVEHGFSWFLYRIEKVCRHFLTVSL